TTNHQLLATSTGCSNMCSSQFEKSLATCLQRRTTLSGPSISRSGSSSSSIVQQRCLELEKISPLIVMPPLPEMVRLEFLTRYSFRRCSCGPRLGGDSQGCD